MIPQAVVCNNNNNNNNNELSASQITPMVTVQSIQGSFFDNYLFDRNVLRIVFSYLFRYPMYSTRNSKEEVEEENDDGDN